MLIVGAVHGSFTIRGEKIDVEYWVDASLREKFEAVIDRGHHLNNLEGAMPPGRKLCGWLVGA